MATAKLEYIPLEQEGIQPLIVQFTNGCLTAGNKRKKEGLEFSYYRWKDSADVRKKDRRTLTAKTNHMEYVGQNFGQFGRVNNLCKYLVGVFDQDTGEMKMYDSKLFIMQPKVLEKASSSPPKNTIDGNKELSSKEKLDRLTEAFGSNKKKNAVAAKKKNLIKKEDLNTAVTEAVKGDLMMLYEEDQKKPTEEKSIFSLPPFNIQAKTPSDVYSLDDIITPVEYNMLKELSKELQGTNKEKIDQWRQEKRFGEYILQHLAVMPMEPSRQAHQSCLLLYLSYLIGMYLLSYKEFRRKEPLKGYPDVIQERLLSTFTFANPEQQSSGRLVPKRIKDKLLSYILVLALFIDDFHLDCLVIAKDLKMDPQRLSKHLQALGCTINAERSRKRKADGESLPAKRTADLVVPLPPNFPNITLH